MNEYGEGLWFGLGLGDELCKPTLRNFAVRSTRTVRVDIFLRRNQQHAIPERGGGLALRAEVHDEAARDAHGDAQNHRDVDRLLEREHRDMSCSMGEAPLCFRVGAAQLPSRRPTAPRALPNREG